MEENTDFNIALGCWFFGALISFFGAISKSPYRFYFYGISILFYMFLIATLVIASNREKGTYISIAEVGYTIGTLFSMIGYFFISRPYNFFFLIPFVFFIVNIGKAS